MKIVIVSKTRMHDMVCVGGLVDRDNKNVRLLTKNGYNQPLGTQYEIGDIWEMSIKPITGIIPPHIEDHIVLSERKVGRQDDIQKYLLGRIKPWKGLPDQLFDQRIRFTHNGSGYIDKQCLSSGSVGFWLPSCDLTLIKQEDKVRYTCMQNDKIFTVTYVGFGDPIQVIPANTLLRVSLARWWCPPNSSDVAQRCFLQLSGWYWKALKTNQFGHIRKQSDKTIDDILVIFETTIGKIIFEFFPNKAPDHVRNFIELSKSGFYNGTRFHRTVPGFMIQGGDPNTKAGDPGTWGTGGNVGPCGNEITLKAEFNDIHHARGVLSMARSQNPHSASSQFFVCVADVGFLDGKYTAFGKVIKGMDVVDKIANAPAGPKSSRDPEGSRPRSPISIKSAYTITRLEYACVQRTS